jgi:hypothetical protein
MSLPKLVYSNQCRIAGGLLGLGSPLVAIAKQLFDRLVQHKGSVPNRNQQLHVSTAFEQLADGRSTADVFELKFTTSETEVLARYIIRVHNGASANVEANREREIAEDIVTGTSNEFFSAQIEDELPGYEYVVIYRHADDQFGRASIHLDEAVVKQLEQPLLSSTTMVRSLEDLLEAVVSQYDKFLPPMVWNGSHYFRQLSPRLLPDILVEAAEREVFLESGKVIITTPDRSWPPRNNVRNADLSTLVRVLRDLEELAPTWVTIEAVLERVATEENSLFRFRSGDKRIWIRVGQQSLKELDIVVNESYSLQFKSDDDAVLTSEKLLARLGYSREAILGVDELEEICSGEDRIIVGSRHSDLHAKNIRWGSDRGKVIDLGSRDTDLLAVSEARLEVSLWDEISRHFEFDDDEVQGILQKLEPTGETGIRTQPFSDRGQVLESLLRGIRLGASKGHSKGHVNNIESRQVALAYVVQCLLYQRYHVERSIRPTRTLDAVFSYWIGKLRIAQSPATPIQAVAPNEGEDVALTGGNDGLGVSAKTKQPTIYDLWEEALRSPEQSFFDARVETVLESLWNKQSPILMSSLTDLQQRVWDATQSAETNPFQSEHNVILAAPTSSGKSTIAEMFLLRPYLLNSKRKCALNIVLSTGENAEHDWRINHGNFAIACMVYEKANILFSQNHRLLERLGCIVVDEFHMLSDLDRGPILEVALTKATSERQKINDTEVRSPRRETLRIIAISTEGDPDKSILKFLSSWDLTALREQLPQVLSSAERPVAVHHRLVLPSTTASEAYNLHNIGYFTPKDQRVLQPGRKQELNRVLYQKYEAARERSRNRNVRQEIEARLVTLVTNIIRDHPRGRQVLVFVPSRQQIGETLAGAIKNALKSQWTAEGSVQTRKLEYQRDIVQPMAAPLENAEDKRMVKTVRDCAEYGVLIHHSDIAQGVRAKIEELCSTMGGASFSRVIIATETLSYGVNLAIHDLVMLGTEFNTRTRRRERAQLPLSQCAFHNMVGRAGRLGKLGSDESNIYIVVPQDQNAYSIIQAYYVEIERADSMVYVNDDKAEQSRVDRSPFSSLPNNLSGISDNYLPKECKIYSSLEAKDFSYPFVRAILDGLRHLNAIAGYKSSLNRASVSAQELVDFFAKTLYAEQFVRSNPGERHLFSCAVSVVLEICALPPLHLVSAEGDSSRSYSITPRGEAVIDTGTEIETVEPLLRSVRDVQSNWEKHYAGAEFPVELLLLCVLAQNEVLRDYIINTPESRQYSWPQQLIIQNREHVFEQLVLTLGSVIPSGDTGVQQFASELRVLVTRWMSVQKYKEAYEGGAADSVLRFFNGIMAWINGKERTEVNDLIEGINLPEGKRGRMERLRQFTDLLSYKILFVAKILITPGGSDDRTLESEEERRLRLLAARIRLGCKIEAIPLFWPWSSNFNRQEAVKLLGAGITPSRLLLAPALPSLNTLGIDDSRVAKLVLDLESHAQQELEKLHAEMTVGQRSDFLWEVINQLWENTAASFKKGIKVFRDKNKPSARFDTALRATFTSTPSGVDGDDPSLVLTVRQPQFGDRYRITVDANAPNVGLVWYGEKLNRLPIENDDDFKEREQRWDRAVAVNILGVQFHLDWMCTLNDDRWRPFKEVLHSVQSKRHLVIVPLPWLPIEDEMPQEVRDLLKERAKIPENSTTIMTPIAFATMTTFILRDFVSSEDCVNRLTRSLADDTLFSVIATKDVLELADTIPERQVPPIIREKIVELFEV